MKFSCNYFYNVTFQIVNTLSKNFHLSRAIQFRSENET